MSLSMREVAPAPPLRGLVTRATVFAERTPGPLARTEAPLLGAVVLLVRGPRIEVDGAWTGSFAGGLYDRPVVTGHAGEQAGVQLNLSPLGARRLLGVPMHELTNRVVALADLFDRDPETPAELEAGLLARLDATAPVAREVAYAYARLEASHGAVRVETLAREVGWSRRHLAARFRDAVGMPPKAVARLARIARAAELLRAGGRAVSLADVAYGCGFSDQSHFTREFRSFTGTTPTQFPNVQDAAAAA